MESKPSPVERMSAATYTTVRAFTRLSINPKDRGAWDSLQPEQELWMKAEFIKPAVGKKAASQHPVVDRAVTTEHKRHLIIRFRKNLGRHYADFYWQNTSGTINAQPDAAVMGVTRFMDTLADLSSIALFATDEETNDQKELVLVPSVKPIVD